MTIQLKSISVQVLLQPRTFIYKRRQKQRKCLSFNKKNNLSFGSAGLLILRPLQLTSNQLYRFKLFLKRASKKPDATKRFVWFYAFPHLPLTRKANGVRMGKGKGKLECWFTNISGGSILIEFKNLRRGRSFFFMRQMSFKIGIPTKYLFITKFYLTLPISISKQTPLSIFW